MTFNLRTEADVDGINHFNNRKGRVLETISGYAPSLIGFQEATDSMRSWLNDELPKLGYAVQGCGRMSDYRGESTVLAYPRRDFELISLENKWLSPTPRVPGSRFAEDQSGCPRIFTAAELKPRQGDRFIFLNTHLDHKGKLARLIGAEQIMQYLSERGLHFVITGDMNARPDAPEIAAFTSSEPCGRPVIDATASLGGTFHAFGKLTPEQMSKIDYIFTDMACDASKSFVVPDEPVDGIYISDHRPVVSYIEI